MSTRVQSRRFTVRDFCKGKEQPFVCLTAYTMLMARLLDAHADLLLVGDSLGMVLYGMPTTLPVTLEMMIAHGAAVMRGASRACVTVDMPFGSYQESPEQAFRNAARILAQTGCAGVKLEGGSGMAETVRFLVRRGVPVCGHVGLMPQAVPVPTIGIGASPACDGQILVTDDLLGLFSEFTPRFVKRYAELGPLIADAAAAYSADVRARRFPEPDHCFGAKVA
jgi:3-methyl-2-oxobutanoate hydroxymethyltransferase